MFSSAQSLSTKSRMFGWIAAGGIAAAIALLVLYQFASPFGIPTAKQTGVEAAKEASSATAGTVSIAVLPFVNLSGDTSQEFFSDGITEEITSALAKVPDLRVVARTSAFQFKTQNSDIQSIGQQLHATHLIEGSVRKAGTRVRITVQLISAANGTHIWSEDYDRELTDIFAIQEDIARTITTSLRMPLGLKAGENLVNNRSVDAESYQQFLRAKALVLQRTAVFAQAIQILEPLVARNPDYAPAWAQLAAAYRYAAQSSRNASADEFHRAIALYLPKQDAATRRAVALDPNFVEGYLLLGLVQNGPGKLTLKADAYAKALALDPNHPEALNAYSNVLLVVGRVKEALAMKQRLQDLEPFVPVYSGNLAGALWLDGQNDAAIAILKANLGRGASVGEDLARVYASLGRYEEAADVVSKLNGRLYPPDVVAAATRLLRSAPAKVAPKTLPRLGTLGFVYLHLGAPERVLEVYEDGAKDGFYNADLIAVLSHPAYAPVRKLERYKAFVRGFGLADYWRERGWPSFCHPTTGDDFVCV